jgi:hypothetical protein
MNAALFRAIEDWGDTMSSQLKQAARGQSYAERFTEIWSLTIESIASEREIWSASIDVAAQSDHIPELKALLANGPQSARTGNVALFEGVDEDTVDEHEARAMGGFYQALISGVLIQWLVDPTRAPTAEDLTEALRSIAQRV